MRRYIGGVGLLFLTCVTAVAQDKRAEVFLGYSYARINPNTPNQPSFNLNGGSTSFAYDLTESISLVADFGGYHIARIGDASADVNFFSFLFGPRFSYGRHARVTPFAHALFGGVSTSYDGTVPPGAFVGARAGGFAMTLGGGVDTKMSERLAFRLIQAEYFLTQFHEFSASPGSPLSSFPGVAPALGRVTQNNLRISTGIALRF